MNINDFLNSRKIVSEIKENAPRLFCEDGVNLSVQASRMHYCTPREDSGVYSEVEVGFPSIEPPETWAEYMDGDWDNEDRTATVYGYVPIKLVEDFIAAHGGITNKQRE